MRLSLQIASFVVYIEAASPANAHGSSDHDREKTIDTVGFAQLEGTVDLSVVGTGRTWTGQDRTGRGSCESD